MSGSQGLDTSPPASTSQASDFNLPDLLVNSYNQAQTLFKSIAAGGGGGGGQGLATATQGTQETAQASADIATLQGAAAAKLHADNLEAATRYGMIPGMGSLNVVAISDAIKGREEKIFAQQNDLEARLHQGFTDDPLQWIVNQFKIPAAARELMQLQSDRNDDFSVLKQMADRTEDAYKVNAGIDTADAVATAAALSRQAFGQAKERLAKDQFSAAQIGIQATQVRLAATRDAFNSAIQLNTEINQQTDIGIKLRGEAVQEQQLTIAQSRNAMEKDAADRAAAQAPFLLNLEKLNSQNAQERQDSKDDLQKKLNTATVINNLPQLSVEQYLALPDKKLQQFLTDQMFDPSTQGGRYGFDAATAVQRLNASEVTPPAGVDYTRDRLTGYMQKVFAAHPYDAKTMDPAALHALIQNEIGTSLKKEALNIPDIGGMFSPGPLVSTLKIPAVLATDIGKALAPLADKNPTYGTKAQDVFATAALLIQQGKLTPMDAASQISDIYNAVAVDVNQQRQFSRFKFEGPSQSSGYRQTVITGNTFSSGQNVNLLDKGAILSTLTRMIYQEGLTLR